MFSRKTRIVLHNIFMRLVVGGGSEETDKEAVSQEKRYQDHPAEISRRFYYKSFNYL